MSHRNTSSRPPSAPPDTAHAHMLATSLSMLSIRSSGSPATGSSPLSRSRRPSLVDHTRSPTPSGRLSRTPSTPNLRKRASMSSLTTPSTSNSTTGTPMMRRKSSLLSMTSSPVSGDLISPVREPLLPPPQDMYAGTTVLLSDSSYGHKYSRPRTSAVELANIVERPERIPAAVYGVAAAQVRAGKDRISIRKTARTGKLSDPEVMLVHAHTTLEKGKMAWPEELVELCRLAPEKLKRGEVEIPNPYHKGDLYLSSKSLEDMQGCIGALYEGVDLVYGDSPVKRGFVCIRPPGHHCAEAHPSGFCFLNNVHVAIAHAAKEFKLTHAVILDFDLHHGDGSQAIAWSLNNLAEMKNPPKKRTGGIAVPNIGYFSMHDINSFPCESGVLEIVRNASVNLEAHNQFIHNVHMKSYDTLAEFWELYETRYKTLITKAREFLVQASQEIPKKGREFNAGIFISAGFDASEHEGNSMQRHAVCVPTDFFARFTSDAVSLAEEYCDGRVLSVLEGGYSDRAITSGVFAHMSGLACASPLRAEYFQPSLVSHSASSLSPESFFTREVYWDSAWWSVRHLEELEKLTIKVTSEPKPVEKRSTSFMSPTAASVARQAEGAPRRVMSSNNLGGPSPPPPPTPWQELAYSLAQRFIPEYEESKPIPALPKPDRAAPKTRHSIAGTTAPDRMQLRERKPRAAAAAPPPAVANDRTRRKTTALETSTAPTSRAPSRVQSRANSRAPTPSIANPRTRPATSAGNTRPSKTTMNAGTSIAAPRPPGPHRKSASASMSSSPAKSGVIPTMMNDRSMDELAGKLQKVSIRLTHKNKDLHAEAERRELEKRARIEREQMERAQRQREEEESADREREEHIAQIEREKADLEAQLAAALAEKKATTAAAIAVAEESKLMNGNGNGQNGLNGSGSASGSVEKKKQHPPLKSPTLKRQSGLPVKSLAAKLYQAPSTPSSNTPTSPAVPIPAAHTNGYGNGYQNAFGFHNPSVSRSRDPSPSDIMEEDEPDSSSLPPSKPSHVPESPPIILTGINGVSYGVNGDHHRVPLEGFGSPGETLVDGEGREEGRPLDGASGKRDFRFHGGEIKFGEPFPGREER